MAKKKEGKIAKDNYAKDEPTLAVRFELLIKARNFLYENFSKWMTYFYVAISALFIIVSKNFDFRNLGIFLKI